MARRGLLLATTDIIGQSAMSGTAAGISPFPLPVRSTMTASQPMAQAGGEDGLPTKPGR